MKLEHYEPIGLTGAAYGWWCNNDRCLNHDLVQGIEDHRYDWLAYGLSAEQLEEAKADGFPHYDELAAEQAEMRLAYESTRRKRL